jgi:hypothetical protein
MKIIKEIAEHIEEEMDGICEYIRFANKAKAEHDYVYDVLMEIIPQEVKHVEMLHDAAVREIERARSKLSVQGKEIPPYMLEMWQEEHEEYIDKMAEIRYKIDILKR